MILRAKNWQEFQHYKDRSPIWIKLHKKLLDDRTFHALPDASRALAPMLWLLCSESKDGLIKDAVAEIGFRLRMTEKKCEEALNPLIEAGFFYVEQDDRATLAGAEQDASLEKSRDREEEEERAFAIFALEAKRRGWPEPRKLDLDRRRKLRARLTEHGIEGWQHMIDLAGSSEFINNKFPLKFDWVLEPKNFRKVIEGNYSQGKSTNGNGPAALPPEDPWQQRLAGYKPGGFWHDGNWGPRPETGNCRAPADVLDAWRQGAT